MGKLWLYFTEAYGDKFTGKYGNKPSKTWNDGLADIPGQWIKHALGKLQDKFPTWPPTLWEFKALCKPTPEDLGLPTTTAAYIAACSKKWKDHHPIVWVTAQDVMSVLISDEPERVKRRAWEDAYRERVAQAMKGRVFQLPQPKTDQKQLTRTPLSNEKKRELMQEVRATLAGAN